MKTWDLPFMEVFDVLGFRFRRDGKGMQGTEKTLRTGLGSLWRDGYIHRHRVVSHVFSTALHGSVNWLWSAARTTNIHNRESKILRQTFRPRMRTGEDWVEYRKRSSRARRTKWRKLNLPTMAERNAEHLWKAISWAAYDGDVPGGLRSTLGWRTATWWRNRSAWRMDPAINTRWKPKFWVSQQRSGVDTPLTRWAGEENDWVRRMVRHPPRKGDVTVALMKMLRQPEKKPWSIGTKKSRDLHLMVLEPQRILRALSWRSGATARRWWYGSTTQSEERQSML